jgi:hypothetical protein
VFSYTYVAQNWLLISILLSLEHVAVGFSVDNLTQVLMQVLMNQGGLFKELIGKKLMAFGVDGVYTFQGIKLGVTKYNFEGWVPCCNPNLGFATKVKLAKVQTKKEAHESHLILSKVRKNVK